jgi:hypothetical protein
VQVPKDPNLYLTVFTGICVTIVVAFWILTPVYTPHLEEESEHAALIKPEQALGQVDAMLTAAETTLAEMGGGEMESKALSTQEGSNLANVVPASGPDTGPDTGHDHAMGGHDHAMGGPDHDMGGPDHDMGGPDHNMSGPDHDMGGPDHAMGRQTYEPEESSHSHDAGGDHGH